MTDDAHNRKRRDAAATTLGSRPLRATLQFVLANPGAIWADIVAATGISFGGLGRALADLMDFGCVTPTPKRYARSVAQHFSGDSARVADDIARRVEHGQLGGVVSQPAYLRLEHGFIRRESGAEFTSGL